MSYSTMMHEYFDRTLDGAHEDVLFAELGRNPELRKEFTEHMMLRTAVHNDLVAIRTPVDSTREIFGALGFALPIAEEVQPAAGFFSQFFARYSSRIATAAASSLATALMFFGYNAVNENSSPATVTAEKNSMHNENFAVNSEEKISTEKNSSIAENKSPEQRISFARNISLPVAKKEFFAEPEENILREEISLAGTDAPSFAQTNLPRENNFSGNTFTGFNFPMIFRDPNLSVTVRYSQQLSEKVQLKSPEVGANINWSADGMYDITENSSVGLSAGQSNFGQEFVLDQPDKIVSVKQNPSFVWAGASYSYKFGQLFDFATLYAMATAGATIGEAYPFGRVILGIQMPLYNQVTINAGLEGSGILYQAQGKNYQSGKIGANIGLNFRF